MMGWPLGNLLGITIMEYDWSGVRTRRVAYFKRTTLLFVTIGFPASVGLLIHYFT
jgi:hypothetical protein